jgi:hypothetical protein
MTTAVPTADSHSTRLYLLSIAVIASVVHLLMMIPGYSDNGSFEVGTWLAVLGFSLVVSVLLFLVVVPRGGVTTGVVLGAVALVSVLVFWAGVTLPLAAAAGVIGWRAYPTQHRTLALVALGLAAFSTVATVAIIIGDAMAN